MGASNYETEEWLDYQIKYFKREKSADEEVQEEWKDENWLKSKRKVVQSI